MKISYQEELFQKLVDHPSWKGEVDCFAQIIGCCSWLIIPELHTFPGKNKKIYSTIVPSKECIDTINHLLLTARKTRRVQSIRDKDNELYYCIPIARAEQTYGFIGLCKVKAEISNALLKLFNAFTCTTVESVQKELEISRLYETIRPKTIALSTVHTVGRIISSTLELNELLPRIARLSLQVLRAQRCCIMLVDKYKRNIIPHAIVDIENKSAKQHPLKWERD